MSVIRLCIVVLASCPVSAGAEDFPDYVSRFRQAYCVECHGPQEPKGDFRIDSLEWNLIDGETRQQWDLVRDYVADGDMPPQTASKHPDAAVVKGFVARLEADFARADQISKPGGTPIRRLNRVEYLNTVRDLFGIRMINLPASFPDDASDTEFDTTTTRSAAGERSTSAVTQRSTPGPSCPAA